jgi:hypothetical protein
VCGSNLPFFRGQVEKRKIELRLWLPFLSVETKLIHCGDEFLQSGCISVWLGAYMAVEPSYFSVIWVIVVWGQYPC